MKKIVWCYFLSLLLITSELRAEDQNIDQKSRYEISGFTGAIYIDEKLALEEGIDDVGYLIGASFTGYKSFLRYSAGIAFIILGDNDRFTQTTESVFGSSVSDEDSSIDAGTIYLELGSQYSFGAAKKANVGLMFGYSYFDIDRTISNCRDCYSENIDLNSSTYFRPFITYQLTDKMILGLDYASYLRDQSFDDSISARFGVYW